MEEIDNKQNTKARNNTWVMISMRNLNKAKGINAGWGLLF